jgi:hypothetical protein
MSRKNPYVSILMDFGWSPDEPDEYVEFVPTTSKTAVSKQWAQVAEEKDTEDNKKKGGKAQEKKRRQEGDDIAGKPKNPQKRKPDSAYREYNIQQRSKQIAIAVHGLDGYGYKCLSQDGREKWKDHLEDIRLDTRESWRVEDEDRTNLSVKQKLLLSGMHLTMDPGLESIVWGSS